MEARAQQREGLTLKAGFAPTVSKPVRMIGFWSAVLATVFSVRAPSGIAVILVMLTEMTTGTTPGWQGIEAYVTSSAHLHACL